MSDLDGLRALHAELGRALDAHKAENPNDAEGIALCSGKQRGVGLAISHVQSGKDTLDAARYRYLRNRPEDAIGKGGLFAGSTPPTGKGGFILTEEDLDRAVDYAMGREGDLEASVEASAVVEAAKP